MLKRIAILALLIPVCALAQDSYVPAGHPVYEWLRYLEIHDFLKEPLPEAQPLLRSEILNILKNTHTSDFNPAEKRIYQYYLNIMEFPLQSSKKRFSGALSSTSVFVKSLSHLWSYNYREKELHLLTHQDSNLVFSIDWGERIRRENREEGKRRIETDILTFTGDWRNRLLFGSEVVRYREYDSLSVRPEEYRQPFRKAQMGGDFVNWDDTHAYILWNAKNIDLEFARYRFLRGVSGERSMFLSGNTMAFTNFSLGGAYSHWRFRFFHGELLSQPDSTDVSTGFRFMERKFLSSHILTWHPGRYLQLSAAEAVVYNRESPDLSYLLPFLWYKQLEHNLGDRDNLLVYLEGKLIIPSLGEIYGAVLLDEFSISKITEDWWANKQGYQTGVRFPWRLFGVPNLTRLEFTVIRPWVYSHERNGTTYTHAGFGLGFPAGPNSSTVYLSDQFWISERFIWKAELENVLKGQPTNEIPIGSDPNDNYSLRDKTYDEKTGWLMGKIEKKTRMRLSIMYRVSDAFYLSFRSDMNPAEAGLVKKGIYSVKVNFDY